VVFLLHIIKHIFILSGRVVSRVSVLDSLGRVIGIPLAKLLVLGTFGLLHFRRIHFHKLLFVFQVGVKVDELAPDLANHFHFTQQDRIQVMHILFNVTRRLVHLVQQVHVFLHDINDVIDVLSVISDKFFFFRQDCLDETLVVHSHAVHIISILPFQIVNMCHWNLFQLRKLRWNNEHLILATVKLPVLRACFETGTHCSITGNLIPIL